VQLARRWVSIALLRSADTLVNLCYTGTGKGYTDTGTGSYSKGKDMEYSSLQQLASSLQELSCHMGSHSVTYHPASFNPAN